MEIELSQGRGSQKITQGSASSALGVQYSGRKASGPAAYMIAS